MTEMISALFAEAAKQPLATFLLILVAVVAAVYFILIYPKTRKEKLDAQLALASSVASSNECIRNSSTVISALGECVKNNTQALELNRHAMGTLCDQVDQLQDRMMAHDTTTLTVLQKVAEISAKVNH